MIAVKWEEEADLRDGLGARVTRLVDTFLVDEEARWRAIGRKRKEPTF